MRELLGVRKMLYILMGVGHTGVSKENDSYSHHVHSSL